MTPFDKVKVVILGQDPYHGAGQAHGLSFSVRHGIAPPPSLQNIYKEMANDLGLPHPGHGNLDSWANQGVLLLNSCLTVEDGKAAAHAGKGWESIYRCRHRRLERRSRSSGFCALGAQGAAKRPTD